MRFADSTDRCTADYLKFGIGFFGFMWAVGGIVFGSIWATVLGGIVFFAILLAFFLGDDTHCDY